MSDDQPEVVDEPVAEPVEDDQIDPTEVLRAILKISPEDAAGVREDAAEATRGKRDNPDKK